MLVSEDIFTVEFIQSAIGFLDGVKESKEYLLMKMKYNQD